MFRGTAELNFTPDEAEAVGAAEGRPRPPRHPRPQPHRPVAHHHPVAHPDAQDAGGGLAIGFIIACVLLICLVVGFDEIHKTNERRQGHQIAAAGNPSSPRTDTGARPSPGTKRPTRKSPRQPASPRQRRAAPSPPAPQGLQPRRVPPPPEERMPPGWGRGSLKNRTPLFANPTRYTRILEWMPAGTHLFIRQVAGTGPCWHTVVTQEAPRWGYACVTREGAKPAWEPLPEEWEHRLLSGDMPARLQDPGGVIAPGTGIVMRQIGETERFFVISEDGLTFGYGHLTVEHPPEFRIQPGPGRFVRARKEVNHVRKTKRTTGRPGA